MRRLKMLIGSLGALTLAAVLAVGGTALVTPAADASPCLCPPDTWQSNGWGMGSTCAQAQTACTSSAQSNANATCQGITGGNACGFVGGTVYHGACYIFGSGYKVDCHVLTRCQECVQFSG